MSKINENTIFETVRKVIDPELGASVVDLNMIKKIEITEDKVLIRVVLTAPGCPLAGWIVQQIRQAVETIPGVQQVDVQLLDEPWQPANDDWKTWFGDS